MNKSDFGDWPFEDGEGRFEFDQSLLGEGLLGGE